MEPRSCCVACLSAAAVSYVQEKLFVPFLRLVSWSSSSQLVIYATLSCSPRRSFLRACDSGVFVCRITSVKAPLVFESGNS